MHVAVYIFGICDLRVTDTQSLNRSLSSVLSITSFNLTNRFDEAQCVKS